MHCIAKSQCVKIDLISSFDTCIYAAIELAISKEVKNVSIGSPFRIIVRITNDSLLYIMIMEPYEINNEIKHNRPNGCCKINEKDVFFYYSAKWNKLFIKSGRVSKFYIREKKPWKFKKKFVVPSIIYDPYFYIFYYEKGSYYYKEINPDYYYFWL